MFTVNDLKWKKRKIPSRAELSRPAGPLGQLLGLGVTGEVLLHALREKTFAAALAASRQGRTSSFSAHAGAKAVLALTCAFRSLKSAFHN